MKYNYLILTSICLLFLIVSCDRSKKDVVNENIIKLPLTEIYGYGPFKSAMGGMSPYSESENNPWKKTELKTVGIPSSWTDVKVGDINTDIYQLVFESYHTNAITKAYYEQLQNNWNWIPDSLNLSKAPIKTKIAFAFGKDSIGEVQMIVDTNNNLDFSDDKIFKPTEIDPKVKFDNDSLAKANVKDVNFERFVNNEITTISAPLLIVYMKEYNMFLSNFPQYATTSLEGVALAVASNGFKNLSYDNSELVTINSIPSEGKADENVIILENEYIEINGNTYKNRGVNKNENVLVLEKMKEPKDQLFSAQVGYKAFPFSGKEFSTGASVSLEGLKGKYVLLDFWATWCGPCIQELPNLRAFYENTARSKFEIVSIIGDSAPEDVTKMIEKYSISWPQIFRDDSNRIKEQYGIRGYPTTFLVNPDGVIIAKNLRGKDLEQKIEELIKE